jgi:beta-galactosidase GanA
LFSINVDIVENKLFLDGKPFYMKGICYHPVPKGSTKRNFLTLNEDLILMKEAGINTIRVYEPIDDIDVLNAINNADIKIIISFGYNQKGIYDIVSGTYIEYVKKYLDHNAILMWELGN